jgi:hypothetical protein
MKSKTLLFAALSIFGMVVAGGTAMGVMSQSPTVQVNATSTTVASYSRSGTTDTVTGGTFSKVNVKAGTGYYQDDSAAGTCSIQILSTTALFSADPGGSIDIVSTLGGGTTKSSGVNVQAALLDSSGNVLGSSATITDAITATTGSEFITSFPTTNYASVYGVKIFHTKISGWNLRYYSLKLNGNDTFAKFLSVATQPTKTTYKVGDTLDLTGLVVNKTSAPQTAATATTAYTTSPANGATLTADNTVVTVTSTETGVTGTQFALVLDLTPTQAIAKVTAAGLASRANLPGTYIISGTVKTVTDATNHRFVVTDGTKDVYAYGYSSTAVTDLCVGGAISVQCTLGAYTNSYSTDRLTELSSLTILSNVNPAETFAEWMMNATRDTEACSSKWTAAKAQFNSLGAEQKTLFLTGSSVTVIVNARARYTAWAAANNESVSGAALQGYASSNDNATILLASLLGLGAVAAGAYLFKRRKHA